MFGATMKTPIFTQINLHFLIILFRIKKKIGAFWKHTKLEPLFLHQMKR